MHHVSLKGTAGYYDGTVDGKTNRDAACSYPGPKSAAANVRGKIAFWRGIEVDR
jgi:uncharacterized protein (DUF427 family)